MRIPGEKKGVMDTQVSAYPFLIVSADQIPMLAGTDDQVVMGVSVDDGWLGLELPQFGIEVWVDQDGRVDEEVNSEALQGVVTRLLAFYSALRELPDTYIHEVETIQRDIIERHLLPWLGNILGRNPGYFTLPADAATVGVDKFPVTA